MDKYHTAIIGAGPAGYTAALNIAAAGKSVCLIDKDREKLGGTCLNRGCIPVKSFLESANFYQKIKSADSFGVKVTGAEVNLDKIKEKANKNIDLLKKGVLSLLQAKKVHLEFGKASFISNQKIQLKNKNNTKKIEADNFILATGSLPKKLPNLDIDNKKIFDSNSLCRSLPQAKNILIVGGGYIGSEFAHFYNSLGSEVTIVDIAESLLPGQDKDIISALEKEFRKKGIKLLTAHKITQEEADKFDIVIIAVGRKPNISSLNLEKAGIERENSFIKIDKNFKTTADNIYAVGDLINTPMLAHVALAEGKKTADFLLGKNREPINYRLVPEVIFTKPQIASIGLKETEANHKGIEIEIKKKFFRAVAKAHILGQAAGFSKLIFAKKNKKLLGASIIGPQATELIHLLAPFIKAGLPAQEFEQAIYAHPTLSEIFSS
ncbi:MAG: dihydrolipoyl dehydrogenase [Candidatus Omnitrophica bacterium]|nr:dihydrolipoyl dehydrogenase [Candidatus Omnitrophota bacterium]MCF7878949.1 dihydrolipoyl dehydrogenase [Candidatus Omnitrophota bacterium]MCF7888212.1 dihydrolipoyl dehydrogenase [Candidatus Omnitrophota bacterium]